MIRRWSSAGTLLVIALIVAPSALPGQDKKPAPDAKPAPDVKPSPDAKPAPDVKSAPAPKELVFKGTLTGLEQEVAHTVPLRKDQTYTISVDSRGFITDMRLEDAQGKKLKLAAGGSSFKAPADGLFRLLISSPGGSTGQYVVSVRPVNLTAAAPGEVLNVGQDGLSIEAVLTKEDPLDKVRKMHCRIYDVNMQGGKTYVVDLVSKQFDAFLRLEDAAGKQLAHDDDSGGGTNARIRFNAPHDGVFRIIATSFGPQTGLFLLKVRQE
jgi:hypothetical protein